VPSLFLLFNHRVTAAQQSAARKQLGVAALITLPPELQQLWSQIPPELPTLAAYLEPLETWLISHAQANDYVLIQGDFGATFLLVRFALNHDFIPVYATTSRQAIEEHLPDGAVKMVHRFQHQMFRRYGE
jgi:hypothetical protein